MKLYTGPFELVNGDGTEYSVEGSLDTEIEYNNLRSWHGSFTGDIDFNEVGNELTVRLPDGREGKVLIQNMDFSPQPVGRLLGNGPAPA